MSATRPAPKCQNEVPKWALCAPKCKSRVLNWSSAAPTSLAPIITHLIGVVKSFFKFSQTFLNRESNAARPIVSTYLL